MRDRPFISLADAERFREIVSCHRQIAVCVAQIDPDGIGSALALERTLKALGVGVTLYYGEPFGHPQSVALWRMLELESVFRPMRERPASMPVALVDSSELEDHRFGGGGRLDPIVILDHHDGQARVDADRFWCIKRCGAASSLALHLAHRMEVDLDERTATAVAVGIFTDSEHLASPSTTTLDDDMFHRAKAICGQARFTEAMEYRMRDRHCRLVTQALMRMSFERRTLLAHPGERLLAGEGEALADAAELLRRHEDAELVLVWGVVGSDLRVSARARGPVASRLTPILKRLFGANAGSKHGAGGARRPLSHEDERRPDLLSTLESELRFSVEQLTLDLFG